MRIIFLARICFVFSMMSVLLSTTCIREDNLAANGKCLASFIDLPDDSIYSVMSCSLSLGEGRIEQLIKPISPILIRSQDITISLIDSIDITFEMLDVWGNKRDSIYINEPTFIAFDIKMKKQLNSRKSLYYDNLKIRPYARLIERTDNDSVVFMFDFNERIFDNRYKELCKFCNKYGVESKIPKYANSNSSIFFDEEYININFIDNVQKRR